MYNAAKGVPSDQLATQTPLVAISSSINTSAQPLLIPDQQATPPSSATCSNSSLCSAPLLVKTKAKSRMESKLQSTSDSNCFVCFSFVWFCFIFFLFFYFVQFKRIYSRTRRTLDDTRANRAVPLKPGEYSS